jgi:hypothetical protein
MMVRSVRSASNIIQKIHDFETINKEKRCVRMSDRE